MISLKPIRGMHDRLPEACEKTSHIMDAIYEVAESFGYKEIVLPIVEATELFKRTVGDSSDIVQKEMYSFQDRNDESLTLRPEGTAGCFRAYLSEYQRSSPYQRLWYHGPMYRRERPQKGRQREFYQFGIEAFGYQHPSIDVEIINIAYRIFQKINLQSPVVCKINFLGTAETRKSYLTALRVYFKPYITKFDEVHLYRYEQNVLRLLDSKDEYVCSLIQNAPKIIDYLSDSDLASYDFIKKLLTKLSIPYEEDHTLVRGLDYYSGLIYEWQAIEGLGAQNTICAGGRTDKLCSILSGKPGFSLGMAIGIERLSMLIDYTPCQNDQTVFLCTDHEAHYSKLMEIQSLLQKKSEKTYIHFGVSQLKKQLNRAGKMNYNYFVGFINEQWMIYDLKTNEKLIINDINEVWEKLNACRT